MIHNTVGTYIEFRTEDHTRYRHGKRVICSNMLIQHLGKWITHVEDSGARVKQDVINRLYSWLRLFKQVLELCENDKSLNKHLFMTLVALFDSFADALTLLTNSQDPHVPPFRQWMDKDSRELMIVHGWCPYEIRNAQNIHTCQPINVFLQNMTRLHAKGEHSRCDTHNCLEVQIDSRTFQPKHIEKICACSLRGPDAAAVETCLLAGSYPLLTLTGRLIEVEPYVPGMLYVALSHVWADGLGNPHDMKLPRCQLERLRELLLSFSHLKQIENGRIKYGEHRKLYLWIDTLCCPIAGTLKSVAIARLRDIYTNSTYCLVVDRSIMSYNYADIEPVEAVMRIVTSRWNYRGWTLQEGRLPRNVIFAFKDRLVPGSSIFLDLWLSNLRAKSYKLYTAVTQVGSRYLVNFRHSVQTSTANSTWHDLIDFSQRRFSVASDEPLCLATIMGIDGDKVINAGQCLESRMKMVWKLCSESDLGLSTSIVFSSYPRLQSRGYRWAPRSVLDSEMFAALRFGYAGDKKGLMTDKGLLVSGRAWQLRSACKERHTTSFRLDIDVPESHHHVYVRTLSGRWSQMVTFQSSQDNAISDVIGDVNKRHIILFDVNEEDPAKARALLARCVRFCDGRTVLETVYNVIVQELDPRRSLLMILAEREANRLQEHWTTKCLTRMRTLAQVCQVVADVVSRPSLNAIRIVWWLSKFSSIVKKHFQSELAIMTERLEGNHDMLALGRMIEQASNGVIVGGFVSLVSMIMRGQFCRVVRSMSYGQQHYVD